MSDLKQKAIRGVFWSAIEKFSAQGVQFVLGIILARLLTPRDYGLVGMLAIFIAISQAFVLSGFGSALIQKKDRDEKDFSTTFYYNIVVAILFYTILFFLAPSIASFYKEPLLVDLTRAISLTLVIEAFSVVQIAKFTINVDFKSQSKASLSSVIISGIVGITMAIQGYGVWALVAQSLTKGLVNVIMLWKISKWVPTERFSFFRFKKLFFFGSRLLLAGIVHSISQNISKIVIGKVFSTQTLGFYTRADQFARFPSANIESILGRVTFPVLCSIQDDREQLLAKHSQIIRLAALVIFPMMVGLIILAQPLILSILTEKWANSIWMLRIICIGLIFLPINGFNVTLYNVLGRSDLFFRTDLIKQVLIIGFLVVSIPYGIKYMLWGQVIALALTYFINLLVLYKIFGHTLVKQIFYFLPIIINCLVMALAIYITTSFIQNAFIKLTIGIFVGAITYLAIVWIFNISNVKTIFSVMLNKD